MTSKQYLLIDLFSNHSIIIQLLRVAYIGAAFTITNIRALPLGHLYCECDTYLSHIQHLTTSLTDERIRGFGLDTIQSALCISFGSSILFFD